MHNDTMWAVSGLFGVAGLMYQFVGWCRRIKEEEAEKEKRRPRCVVYRLDR